LAHPVDEHQRCTACFLSTKFKLHSHTVVQEFCKDEGESQYYSLLLADVFHLKQHKLHAMQYLPQWF